MSDFRRSAKRAWCPAFSRRGKASFLFGAVLSLTAGACRRQDESADTLNVASARRSTTVPERTAPPELGIAVLYAADSTGRFWVVPLAPNTPVGLAAGEPISLGMRDGQLANARVISVDVAKSDGCSSVTTDAARVADYGIVGTIHPLAAEPIVALAQSDSEGLARRVTAIASVIPGDSAGRFRGLPFSLVSLWRIHGPAGRTVVATLRRQIPQEADPLEERTFIVAAEDSATGGLTLEYSERASGPEETVESVEFLGALESTPGPMLLIGRDFGDAIALTAMSRDRRGKWIDRWTSARRSC